jgi:hypothetical protein
MILKRAMKGELDLMGPAMAVQKELMAIPEFGNGSAQLFDEENKAVSNMKKCILMVSGTAVQKYMMTLAKEQEILMHIADMAIDTYVAESVLLRVRKLVALKGEEECQIPLAMDRLNIHAKNAIQAISEGDEQRMLLMGLKRFTKTQGLNTVEARRKVAVALITANKYCF